MDKIKQAAAAAQEHVQNHRLRYTAIASAAVTTTVAGAFVVQRAKLWNEFLNEHGLLDEFYEALEQ